MSVKTDATDAGVARESNGGSVIVAPPSPFVVPTHRHASPLCSLLRQFEIGMEIAAGIGERELERRDIVFDCLEEGRRGVYLLGPGWNVEEDGLLYILPCDPSQSHEPLQMWSGGCAAEASDGGGGGVLCGLS